MTMAVPKKKISKTQKRKRHSTWQKEKMTYRTNKMQLVESPTAKKKKLAHTVCPYTGYYKGKQVRTIKQKDKGSVVDAD